MIALWSSSEPIAHTWARCAASSAPMPQAPATAKSTPAPARICLPAMLLQRADAVDAFEKPASSWTPGSAARTPARKPAM